MPRPPGRPARRTVGRTIARPNSRPRSASCSKRSDPAIGRRGSRSYRARFLRRMSPRAASISTRCRWCACPMSSGARRAADHLVRSGGFGLVVLDLAGDDAARLRVPVPLLTRLLGLARTHDDGGGPAHEKIAGQRLAQFVDFASRRSLARTSGARCDVSRPCAERQAPRAGMAPRRGVPWIGWPALTWPPFRCNCCSRPS